jgi:hypothetical protein
MPTGRKARIMKKTTLAIAILLMAVGSTAAQKSTTAQRRPAIKQVQVSIQAVSRQPASKAYTLDLTRKGTIYNLASGVDYSRVRVRTAKGDMTMAELIQKSGKSISGALRIGMTSDIRTQKLSLSRRPAGGGGLNFSCQNLVCVCTGDQDCNDLFTSDLCGDIAICYPDGCVCLRI